VASTATRHRPRRVCLAMVDPRQDVCGLRKRGKVFRVSLALVRRLLLSKCTNFGAHVFVDFVQFLDITRRPNGTYRLSNKGVVSVTAVASPRRSLWPAEMSRNSPAGRTCLPRAPTGSSTTTHPLVGLSTSFQTVVRAWSERRSGKWHVSFVCRIVPPSSAYPFSSMGFFILFSV
jgi:hypothetical protein